MHLSSKNIWHKFLLLRIFFLQKIKKLSDSLILKDVWDESSLKKVTEKVNKNFIFLKIYFTKTYGLFQILLNFTKRNIIFYNCEKTF